MVFYSGLYPVHPSNNAVIFLRIQVSKNGRDGFYVQMREMYPHEKNIGAQFTTIVIQSATYFYDEPIATATKKFDVDLPMHIVMLFLYTNKFEHPDLVTVLKCPALNPLRAQQGAIPRLDSHGVPTGAWMSVREAQMITMYLATAAGMPELRPHGAFNEPAIFNECDGVRGVRGRRDVVGLVGG